MLEGHVPEFVRRSGEQQPKRIRFVAEDIKSSSVPICGNSTRFLKIRRPKRQVVDIRVRLNWEENGRAEREVAEEIGRAESKVTEENGGNQDNRKNQREREIDLAEQVKEKSSRCTDRKRTNKRILFSNGQVEAMTEIELRLVLPFTTVMLDTVETKQPLRTL